MKLFKWLLVSTVITSAASAKIDVMTDSIMLDEDTGSWVVPKQRGSEIEEAVVQASAAYRQNPNELIDLAIKGYQVSSFNAVSDTSEDYAGFVSYTEENGEPCISVSLRGSEKMSDFTEANLRGLRVENKELGIEGYLHSGFNTRYMQLRAPMLKKIDFLLAQNGKTIGDVKITITGHSLGGALANIAALDLKKNKNAKKVSLVTFSAPRVFDHQGAKQLEDLLGIGKAIRAYRAADIVAGVGPGALGNKHAGTPIRFDANAYLNLLVNHDLASLKKDIVRSEQVKVNLDYIGYRTWMGNKISQTVKTPLAVAGYIASTAGYVVGSISSWFSR